MFKRLTCFLLIIISVFNANYNCAYADDFDRLKISGVASEQIKIIQDNKDIQEFLSQEKLQFQTVELHKIIQDLFYAYGYFDANVNINYKKNEDYFDVHIDAGEFYTVSKLIIDQPPSVFFPPYLLKIRSGDRFNGYKIQKGEAKILQFLNNKECRYIKRVKHIIHLDPASKTAELTFDIGSSPVSVFGTSLFQGQKNIKDDFFPPLLDYQKDTCFQEQYIRNTVKNAINTNLFQNIYYQIVPAKKDPTTEIAKVDVVYSLEERKHRTYEYGVGISDTEKFIVSAGNEWRNISSKGVSLNISTRLSDISQKLNLAGKYPSYFGFRKNLSVTGVLSTEKLDTYNAKSFSTFIGYEQLPFKGQDFSYGFGIRNSFSSLDDSILNKEKYFITAFPVFGLYDTKDDLLRPTRGSSLRLETMPAVNNFFKNSNFLKNQVTGTHYINLGVLKEERDSPSILAFRSSLGSITGTGFQSVPLTERFYAGGGGSVRGYSYQDLGDLVQDKPQGGASMFEASLETRLGIYQDYGVVFFVDSGNVYTNQFPDRSFKLQYAAGIGGRYYSEIIPIRLDIGVPLNPRDNRADNFGFYVGIGEAF